jgi:hypothetical protein
MTPKTIQTVIAELSAEKKLLQKRLNIIEGLIKTYQDRVCTHTHENGKSALVEHTGIGYRYDTCEICLKRIDMR